MRIKLFSRHIDEASQLEQEVNRWLVKMGVNVKDIKQTIEESGIERKLHIMVMYEA